jgi:16S rRNA (guanine966-N2)-methyltransferase
MAGLRVIGGRAGGLRLKSVPGDTTRPITDRVKTAVFNILGPDLEQATWLDLFAGTGAVGIEALSRGASFVRFVDRASSAIAIIRANLEHTRLCAGAEVLRMDAFTLLNRDPDRIFDYIYIAPPQYQGLWRRALDHIDAQPGWLADDGWVIVQIHPKEHQPVLYTNLEEFDRRLYGSTLLIFYRRKSR